MQEGREDGAASLCSDLERNHYFVVLNGGNGTETSSIEGRESNQRNIRN